MCWSSFLIPLLAQIDRTAAAATPGPWYSSVWFMLFVAAAILVIPYMVGGMLAQMWRMPDYGWKLGVILVALTAGVAIDLPPILNMLGLTESHSNDILLGIDLRGGVKLLYELDLEKLKSVDTESVVRAVAEAANKAGNFKGTREAKVVPLANAFEVTLPTTDKDVVEKVRDAISKANLSDTTLIPESTRQDANQTVLVYSAKVTAKAVDMNTLTSQIGKRVNPGGYKEVAIRAVGNQEVEVSIPRASDAEIDAIKRLIATAGTLEFRIVGQNPPRLPEDRDVIDAAKASINNPSRDVSDGERIVGFWRDVDKEVHPDPSWLTRDNETQVFVLNDPYNVTGKDLDGPRTSGELGATGWQVSFRMTTQGAKKFGELTDANKTENTPTGKVQGGHLGILLDGVLKSAPVVQSKITDQGEITGSFTKDEVDFLVGVLKAGSLPAALQKTPISEEHISPELGADTIRESMLSLGAATVAVLVFMLLYYRFAGIVADASVLFNLALVLMFMIMLRAPFTLAGLAGLVLSVGMAVDSNVLIYERMREEKERGAQLRMVIRNGFGRAMATIIDTHSTTIITGLVLYSIGTEQLKGFAVTLVLGLLVNLFTAVFCGRVVFDIAERRRWLTELKMMKLFGETSIDFVAYMKPAITASVLICVLGMVAAYERGSEMFDSDFRGGTVVQLVLKKNEPMTDTEVRELLDSPSARVGLPDPTVNAVNDAPEEKGLDLKPHQHLEYIIRTSNDDKDDVEAALKKLFGDRLQTYSVGALTDLHGIESTSKSGSGSGSLFQKSTAPSSGYGAKTPEGEKSGAKGTEPKGAEHKSSDAGGKAPAGKDSGAKGSKGGATDNHKSSFAPPRRDWSAPTANSLLLALADSKPAGSDEKPKAADAKSSDAKSLGAQPKSPPADASNAPKTAPPESPQTLGPKPTGEESPPLHPFGPTAEAEPGSLTGEVGDKYVGGTEVTLHFDHPIPYGNVKARLETALVPQYKDIPFELSAPGFVAGSDRAFPDWTLRMAMPPAKAKPLLENFRKQVASTPVFLGDSSMKARVAGATQWTAVEAVVASILMIVVYIWIRFQNVIFGLGAVVALVHDVFVTIAGLAISYYIASFTGFLMIEPFKISLNVVAALLTICGYSISDTIVIFDRIREVRGRNPELTEEMINISVNQTLSRTVLTVFTVLLVTVILYVWGGQAIHAFAFTMLIGLISGTYSSVYIAAPCLLALRRSKALQLTRVE